MRIDYLPLMANVKPAMWLTVTWNNRFVGLLDLLGADTREMQIGELVSGDSCWEFFEVLEPALPHIRVIPDAEDRGYFTLANLETTPAQALTLVQVPEAREQLLAFVELCRSADGFLIQI